MERDRPVVRVFREKMFRRCWLAESHYPCIEGIKIHRGINGEGRFVRHLCNDSRCLNPLHMIRGNGVENSQDSHDMFEFEGYIIHYASEEHGKYMSLEMANFLWRESIELRWENKRYAILVWKLILKYRKLEIFENNEETWRYLWSR